MEDITFVDFINEYLMIENSLDMIRLLYKVIAGYGKSLPTNVYCVPGHSDRAGNEEVDGLTRREYKLPFVISF